MQLNKADSQIVFTTVVSNTYTTISVGKVEAQLIQKHSILTLNLPVMVFIYPLQSEAQVVSGQWKPKKGMQDNSPVPKRTKPAAVLQHQLNQWTKLYSPSWPCKQDGGHSML